MRILLTCSLFYVFLATVGCSEFDHLAINNPCDPLYDGPLSCNHVPDTGTLLTPDSHTPDAEHPDQTPSPDGECLDSSGSVMRGWCHIDGTCVMGADENPEDSCQYCHPARSTDSWNHRPDGTGCQVVNGDDLEDGICTAGTCTPSAQEVCECDEESHCSPQGTCVESVMDGWVR